MEKENEKSPMAGLTDKLSNLQKQASSLMKITDEQKDEAERIKEKFQDALHIVELLHDCSADDTDKVVTAIRKAHAFEKKYREPMS